MNVSVVYLVKDPPIDRLALQVEYLRAVADEFVFSVDDRTDPETIRVMESWPGVKTQLITWRNDFSWARNQALPLVTRPWTLHLDPDELPSFEAMNFILRVTGNDQPPKPMGYTFWFLNWWGGIMGEQLNYHWHTRLWKSGHGKWYRRVHELVSIDNKPEPRGSLLRNAPREAYIIHSKPLEAIERDQSLYEQLGERSL